MRVRVRGKGEREAHERRLRACRAEGISWWGLGLGLALGFRLP